MQQPATPIEPVPASPASAAPVVPVQAAATNSTTPTITAPITASPNAAQTPTITPSSMASSDGVASKSLKTVSAPAPTVSLMANVVNSPSVLSNMTTGLPLPTMATDPLFERHGPSAESKLSYEKSTKESSPLSAAQVNAAKPLQGALPPIFSKALSLQPVASSQPQSSPTDPTLTTDTAQPEPRLAMLPNIQPDNTFPSVALPCPVSGAPDTTSSKHINMTGASTNSVPEKAMTMMSPVAYLEYSASIPSVQAISSTRPASASAVSSSFSVNSSTSSGQVQSKYSNVNEDAKLLNFSKTQIPVQAPVNAPQSLEGRVRPLQITAARPIAPRPSAGVTTSALPLPGQKVKPLGTPHNANALPSTIPKMVLIQKQERKMQIMPTEPSKLGPSTKKKSSILSTGTSKKKASQAPTSKKSVPAPPSLASLLLKSLGDSKSKSGSKGELATSSQLESSATKVCVDNISVLGQAGGKPTIGLESESANVENSSIQGKTKDTKLMEGSLNGGSGILSSTMKRARSASEMLEADDTTISSDSREVDRPAKRLALQKGATKPSNLPSSEKNCVDSISRNSVSATLTGQSSVESDTHTSGSERVTPQSTDSRKSILRNSSLRSQIRTGAAILPQGRPLLRSSPIIANLSKDASQADTTATGPTKSDSVGTIKDVSVSDSNSGESKPARTPKSVSWASEEQLTQVVEIYNRLELIKSWDPESEITLPFTSPTLAGLRAHIASEEAQASNQANNPNSITAPSEHGAPEVFMQDVQMHHADAAHMDMDAERRHMEAFRLEQQQELIRRLSSMKAERTWPVSDIEVVLPPECQPEDKVDEYSLFSLCLNLDSIQGYSEPSNTPPSPPQNSSSLSSSFAVDIPLHDTCAETTSDKPMPVSASPANRVVDVNGDSNRNIDNSYGSRPNSYPNNGPDANHFRGQSHNGNADENMSGRKYSGVRDGSNVHLVGNAPLEGGVRSIGFPPGDNPDMRRDERTMNGSPHYNNSYRGDNVGPSHGRGHPRVVQSGGSSMSTALSGNLPRVPTVELHKLLTALHEQRGLPPPLPFPEGMPLPPFTPNGGQGGLNGVPPPFFVHAPPPPGMRMQDMGRGMVMPMMAPLPGIGGTMGILTPPQISGRMPGRQKSKKKCKYFGTKQGCRDGTSCNFSHDI